MNIRKNDTVVVISGEQKGRQGRVLEVMPKKQQVLVEGINIIKRHTKPNRRNQSGGIVEKEAPIHMSKIKPWNGQAGKPSAILMRNLEDGTRVRVWKNTGETID
jgi:large subunit ribosomal protein L24